MLARSSSIDPGVPGGEQSQLHRLPQELLQVVLRCMQPHHWRAARLVSKQFDASLAPLISSITIRQWPAATGSSSKEMSVSPSSSLKQVRELHAVIDEHSHLRQLLQLLAQLPDVQHLTLRGLKPLTGLTQLLFGSPAVRGPCGLADSSTFPAAAAADALARVKTLDLPDSSSSSLPSDLQLPGLVCMTMFSVDNIQHLAGFAPQLQRLECFSMTLTPAPKEHHHAAAAASRTGSPAALESCRTLAAHVVTSSSAKTAVACLSSALPALQQLATLPQLQHTGLTAALESEACDKVTLRDIQAALPNLQLAGQV